MNTSLTLWKKSENLTSNYLILIKMKLVKDFEAFIESLNRNEVKYIVVAAMRLQFMPIQGSLMTLIFLFWLIKITQKEFFNL